MPIGICYDQNISMSHHSSQKKLMAKRLHRKTKLMEDELPCNSDDLGMLLFLNDDTVKQQLNVDKSITWHACNDDINENFIMDATTYQLMTYFKQNGLKMLLFSGNVDAIVSYV
jgi:hypothetical protein